ncbi:MAG: hypothetical protein AAB870_00800 [Patescibacteria group bacterium]
MRNEGLKSIHEFPYLSRHHLRHNRDKSISSQPFGGMWSRTIARWVGRSIDSLFSAKRKEFLMKKRVMDVIAVDDTEIFGYTFAEYIKQIEETGSITGTKDFAIPSKN